MDSNTNRNLEALSKEGKGQLLDERCYEAPTFTEKVKYRALTLYEFVSSPAGFILDGLGIIFNSIITMQPPPVGQVVLLGLGCAKTVYDQIKETEVRCGERFKQACENLPAKEQDNSVNKKG